jgi:AcrR family transcriptional regulator
MPRPAGVRNHDFDEKRAALLGKLTDFALSAALTRPSLRQFAIAANQSEPTLRHYFGDRQGMVIEIISELAARAEPNWQALSQPSMSPAAAVEEFLNHADAATIQERFTRAHAFGMIEGMADGVVGRIYLEMMLEPVLKIFSNKLKATPGGPQGESALRASSLLATAPLFMLGMHQFLLGGSTTVPIDMEETLAKLRDLLSKAFGLQIGQSSNANDNVGTSSAPVPGFLSVVKSAPDTA